MRTFWITLTILCALVLIAGEFEAFGQELPNSPSEIRICYDNADDKGTKEVIPCDQVQLSQIVFSLADYRQAPVLAPEPPADDLLLKAQRMARQEVFRRKSDWNKSARQEEWCSGFNSDGFGKERPCENH